MRPWTKSAKLLSRTSRVIVGDGKEDRNPVSHVIGGPGKRFNADKVISGSQTSASVLLKSAHPLYVVRMIGPFTGPLPTTILSL
jgi:hypothetical protein